jgi:hypothetical protein
LLTGQSGSHYNGIRSARAYDFTGAYSYVELVQAPSASTKADAMFTIGLDANNYYRIYVEEGILICQAKIGGVKRNLFTSAYDPVAHRFWRIRHDVATGNVVFETASGSPDVAASWVLRYNERWDTAAVPLSSVLVELKAGTWQVETLTPGTVIFDTFQTAKQ